MMSKTLAERARSPGRAKWVVCRAEVWSEEGRIPPRESTPRMCQSLLSPQQRTYQYICVRKPRRKELPKRKKENRAQPSQESRNCA